MLTSWANLYGAKNRDQSESRTQARQQTQIRLQEAIEQEQSRSHQLMMADRTSEAQSAAEMAQIENENRQPESPVDLSQETNDSETERLAEARAREATAREAFRQAAERVREAAARESSWQSPQSTEPAWPDRFPASTVPAPALVEQQFSAPQPQPQPQDPPTQFANATQRSIATAFQAAVEQYQPAPDPGTSPIPRPEERSVTPDPRETPIRMERRAAERIEAPAPALTTALPKNEPPKREPPPVREQQPAPRWFALRTVFDFNSPAPAEPEAPEQPAAAPVIAAFSLAGGIGKTSLVATLGRALSARGERVLLVDTAAYGLMPFYFGAQDHRPGVLRTFSPPGTVGDSPIQMLTLDPENLGAENPASDPLVTEIGKYSRGVSRVIIDLATASGAISRRVMKMSPTVLVPIVPDMNSVVSVSSLDRFFEHNQNGNAQGKPSLPFYVLNRFDPSVPLHLDIQEMLRQQLGDRLLPFVLHRSSTVSEALAEGMTVMDYAPDSPVADDFGSLAGWVKSQSAPMIRAYRGVRWSER